MYLKENEIVSKIIKWIRGKPANTLIWDVLCGDSGFDIKVEEYIDMLEKTAEAEMYQFALILIMKLSKQKDMGDAITNVIVNRINEPDPEIGIIKECINEFKSIADQRGIMKESVEP